MFTPSSTSYSDVFETAPFGRTSSSSSLGLFSGSEYDLAPTHVDGFPDNLPMSSNMFTFSTSAATAATSRSSPFPMLSTPPVAFNGHNQAPGATTSTVSEPEELPYIGSELPSEDCLPPAIALDSHQSLSCHSTSSQQQQHVVVRMHEQREIRVKTEQEQDYLNHPVTMKRKNSCPDLFEAVDFLGTKRRPPTTAHKNRTLGLLDVHSEQGPRHNMPPRVDRVHSSHSSHSSASDSSAYSFSPRSSNSTVIDMHHHYLPMSVNSYTAPLSATSTSTGSDSVFSLFEENGYDLGCFQTTDVPRSTTWDSEMPRYNEVFSMLKGDSSYPSISHSSLTVKKETTSGSGSGSVASASQHHHLHFVNSSDGCVIESLSVQSGGADSHSSCGNNGAAAGEVHNDEPDDVVYVMNEKKYKCSDCDALMSTRFSLKRHKKKHTGERPFACDRPGCNKKFSEKSTLKRHIKIHTKKERKRA